MSSPQIGGDPSKHHKIKRLHTKINVPISFLQHSKIEREDTKEALRSSRGLLSLTQLNQYFIYKPFIPETLSRPKPLSPDLKSKE
jgi:hypothetical protein